MKILIIYNTMEYVWHRRFFINALLERGHEVVAVGPFDGWEDRVSQLGIRCCELRIRPASVNPLQDLLTLYDLFRTMRAERPDAVILYTIKPVIYGSIVAHLAGIRRIFSVIAGGRYDQICKVLYRLAFRYNEKVIFQNPDDLNLYIRDRVVASSKAMRVSGSGVDTELFAPAPDATQNGYFILVSRMLWDKGIALYVAAARKLKALYPDAEFALLGPSGDNPTSIPQETLQQWDAEGSIKYLGTAMDIRPHLARCFVYVLPSYYREGIPRTNLEALAMGKAIITTDMPGCRETVIQDVNGFMIPPRSEEALVKAMESFLKTPSLANQMGEASRKLAVEHFKIETINATIIEVLESRTEP